MIRFQKNPCSKTNVGKSKPKMPMIMLSRYNATGADFMRPGQHLAFCTPSALFGKVVKMDFFHVFIRRVAHEDTERETARYMGMYSVCDPEKTLSYKEYEQLAPEVSSCTMASTHHPKTLCRIAATRESSRERTNGTLTANDCRSKT